MEESKLWYQKIWGKGLIAFGVLFLFVVIFFIRQVYIFYNDLSKGKQPIVYSGVKKSYSGVLKQTNVPTGISIDQIKERAAGRSDDPFAGPPTATHEIVEFIDYGCPYCQISVTTAHDIMRLRPDVKFTVRDYPILDLHPEAENAAIAARCVWRYAGSAAFWRYHDMLFSSQESLSVDLMIQMARNLGMDSRFDSCLQNKLTKGAVDQSLSDAGISGVSVTPTFFIDGKRIDGAADLQTILNALGD